MERHYFTNEKGYLAIIWAVDKLWSHLYICPFKFIKDHHALWWHSSKNPSGRLGRWMLRVSLMSSLLKYNSDEMQTPMTFPSVLSRLRKMPYFRMTTSLLSHQLTPSHSQRSNVWTLSWIQHLDGCVLSPVRKLIRKSRNFVLVEVILHTKNFLSIISGHSCSFSKGDPYVVPRRSDSGAFGIFQDVWKDSTQVLLARTVYNGLQVRHVLSNVPKEQSFNRRYVWAAETNSNAFPPFWTVWYWPCRRVSAPHARQSVGYGLYWSSHTLCHYSYSVLWLFGGDSKFR